MSTCDKVLRKAEEILPLTDANLLMCWSFGDLQGTIRLNHPRPYWAPFHATLFVISFFSLLIFKYLLKNVTVCKNGEKVYK